jgi:methionyl-tRNA synthetase
MSTVKFVFYLYYLFLFIRSFLADKYVGGTCPDSTCQFNDAGGDLCEKCGKLIDAIKLIDPKCKICKNTPHIKTSEHLFLDLPKVNE